MMRNMANRMRAHGFRKDRGETRGGEASNQAIVSAEFVTNYDEMKQEYD